MGPIIVLNTLNAGNVHGPARSVYWFRKLGTYAGSMPDTADPDPEASLDATAAAFRAWMRSRA